MAGISNDCMENYETFDTLIDTANLDGHDVLRIITDWHGTQLMTKDFMENLRDCEGYDIGGNCDDE